MHSNIYVNGQVIKCLKAQFSVTHLSSVTFKWQCRLECAMGAYNKKWREAEDTYCPEERVRAKALRRSQQDRNPVYILVFKDESGSGVECRRGLILFLTYPNWNWDSQLVSESACSSTHIIICFVDIKHTRYKWFGTGNVIGTSTSKHLQNGKIKMVRNWS